MDNEQYSNQDLQVRLDLFEGPLDLLLHLIREHEYDIFDIPIAEIVRQYNDYLDLLRELDLNIASEYLVMSATLMRIKSRMLLPPSSEEDEEEVDPREELVQQLLEYQRFKEAAMEMGERPLLGRDVFARKFESPDLKEAEIEGQYLEVDIYQLMNALASVIKNLPKEAVHQIRLSRVSVRERMMQVLDLLRERTSLLFSELFSADKDKQAVVVTFLALLELIRQGMSKAMQIERFGPIRIMSLLDREEADNGH
ncbi:MAG TPA: segregation/condensation protein A [bacterium]|nr:segregation/condensation protein A [bacterium]